jgi:Thioredoxin.
MIALKAEKDFRQEKEKGLKVFVFTAGWCPDCRFIEPFMPEIEKNYPEFQFISVDRDQFLNICQELDIFGIPSFVVYRDGKEIGRFVSKERKTKEEIESFLDSLPAEK